MKNNKFWLAGLAGAVVYFLLGWLVYGMLLMNYLKGHSGLSADLYAQVFKPDTQMVWWALIVSNLLWAFLLALILGWANVDGMGAGARIGLLAGLLMTASIDLGFFSMTNLYTMEGLWVDIAGNTAMTCIVGAVMGMIMGKRSAAAA